MRALPRDPSANQTRGSEPSDEVLMARAQTGDTTAFGTLYDRHAVRAFRVAGALCPDAHRAEDAVQEGFLAIWRTRAKFNPANESFKAWSTGAVMKRAIGTEMPDPASKSVEDRVIALAFFGELNHTEIAALLDLPPGVVKGRMRLGLEKLRERNGVLH
jgi:RNA polymerase sigma-70 factor (ECF subfamily)